MSARETEDFRTLRQFNEMRKNAEQAFAQLGPVAFTTDGRLFGYEAPLSVSLPIGGYVVCRRRTIGSSDW